MACKDVVVVVMISSRLLVALSGVWLLDCRSQD